MISDHVKIFRSCNPDELEELINDWFKENPEFYIRSVKIFQQSPMTWHAYVWYHTVKLEEEEL